MTVNVSKPRQIAHTDQICNPNLLDNADFRQGKLVNQRGKDHYTTTGGVIDRWVQAAAPWSTVDIDADGIKVTISNNTDNYNLIPVTQKFDDFILESDAAYTFTAEILDSGGVHTWRIGPNNIPIDIDKGIFIKTFTEIDSLDEFYVWTANKDAHIKFARMKLEKGMVSTLHLDLPSNPETELQNCKKYLQDLFISDIPWSILGHGLAMLTNEVIINIPAQAMRILPSIVTHNNLLMRTTSRPDGIIINEDTATLTISAMSNNSVSLTILFKDVDTLAYGDVCVLQSNGHGKLLLSAEL